MGEEKRHQLMQNLFGDQSEEEEEEVDSEHESNPQPNSDYNNKMAQLRAGKSGKSKLTIVKFKTLESVDGWEVRQGTYFQDVVASKYDGGMDAKFEFTSPEMLFSFTLFLAAL
ncbi:protein HIGH CHLOROPHYLL FLUORESCENCE PHENOTYPE 173, chloroplastic-like isoform X2 [Malus domestica]|uniref:protein HIGH CHLOROPHYLL FLUORESCENCE PHENOTYPE 173, chloroplastic-like isoform X2 n=1 Tax=Malus domestica TaxID=3750 RepID=UPI003975F543